MIEVCLPGTGGMVPLENRWLTCCHISYQGKVILIDCGEGTQIAIKKAGLKLSRLDLLLITHIHADHVAGLPGLLLTLGNNGKTTPLKIFGPKGMKGAVLSLMSIAPMLPYKVEIEEAELSKGKGSFSEGELEISYLMLEHNIPCLGYSVVLNRKPVFNPLKAEKLSIPLQYYRKLHSGEAVELSDGSLITPDMVTDEERMPLKLCYCTDTKVFDGISDFADGSDLFISEGMYADEGMRKKMSEKGHMLFTDSARLAKKSGVKKLWLTHYSPALEKPESCIAAARKIFPKSFAAYDGIRVTLR